MQSSAGTSPALPVTAVLLGAVPSAIVCNGNRIVPVLLLQLAPKFGHHPLASGFVRTMVLSASLALIGAALVLIQLGIVIHAAQVASIGAGVEATAGITFALGVCAQLVGVLRARGKMRSTAVVQGT